MKLSIKDKTNIISMWRTGQYTKTSLAKKYKVDEKTIRVIVKGIGTDNKNIVELGTAVELMKKSDTSPNDVREIEKAIKNRINTIESDNKLMMNNRTILLESQRIISNAFGNNEVTVSNIKNVTGAIKDIETIANPKPETVINNQNSQFVAVKTLDDFYDDENK